MFQNVGNPIKIPFSYSDVHTKLSQMDVQKSYIGQIDIKYCSIFWIDSFIGARHEYETPSLGLLIFYHNVSSFLVNVQW